MGKINKHEKSTLNNPNKQNKQKSKRKSTEFAETTIKDARPQEKRFKKKKNNIVDNVPKPANKKIIFNDDVAVEVKFEEKVSSETEVNNKKPKSVPDDEAEVKDEDIDAFCDELDEEDNVQFDNWVKLIEDKLGPNKNKHK